MLLFVSGLSSAHAAEKVFNSPDGKISVVVNDEGGKPQYHVTLGNATFIESSPLGVKLDCIDLTEGLELKTCETKTVRDAYELKTIKQSHVNYEATEAVCQFEKGGRRVMDIIFRVSNRDVAYSYKIYPVRNTFAAVIETENSGFVLPEGSTTFLCPMSKPMGGFARTSPSYETSYALDEQMGKNGWGEGYSFPCLFKVNSGNGGWVLISETGTDGSYVGCRLLNGQPLLHRFPAGRRDEWHWFLDTLCQPAFHNPMAHHHPW